MGGRDNPGKPGGRWNRAGILSICGLQLPSDGGYRPKHLEATTLATPGTKCLSWVAGTLNKGSPQRAICCVSDLGPIIQEKQGSL